MAIAQSTNSRAESASKLEDDYIATEVISALRAVTLVDEDSCKLGQSQTNFMDAKVVGIALNSAAIGVSVRVLAFGILEDPFFTFPLNEPIFLKSNGDLSNIEETTGYSVQVGHSLGVGSIFINIREPIEL